MTGQFPHCSLGRCACLDDRLCARQQRPLSVQRAKEVAEKDLAADPLLVDNSDEARQRTLAINQISESLNTIVGDVRQSAENVAAVSTEIAATAKQVSAGVVDCGEQIKSVLSRAA